ncbi:hypothetical protein ACRYI5_00775 [Furfurilactobacillus sp. WILCCON 0119]
MKRLMSAFHARNGAIALFFRDRPLMAVIRHALTILFPFVMMDVLLNWINEAWLRPDGFYFQIFHFQALGEKLLIASDLLTDLVIMLNVVVSICAAYLVGYYYAEMCRRDKMTTGLASAAAYMILNYDYRSADNLFLFNNFGLRGLFLAFVTGIIVGMIFRLPLTRHLPKIEQLTDDDRVFARSQRMFIPLALVLMLFMLLGWLISLVTTQGPLGILNEGLAAITVGNATTRVPAILLSAIISNLLMFIGLASPIAQPRLINYSTFSGANAQFAQAHHTSFGAPYPITLHTLYDVFGNIGGVGGLLALAIAIILVGITHRERRVAYRSLLPALSNLSGIGLVGLPVIFNSIYLIPMVFVPVINMVVGAILIKTKVIPPVVYRIPWTTPGVLQGYVGTGGDIKTLIVAFVLFIVDVALFIPFVKNGNRLQALLIQRDRAKKAKAKGDDHED